jgi:hypothetical protein
MQTFRKDILTSIPLVVATLLFSLLEQHSPFWLALPPLACLLWPRTRRLLTSQGFTVAMLLLVAMVVALATFQGAARVFHTPGFISLLALGAASALACGLSGASRLKGLAGFAFLALHLSIPVILLGGVVKNYQKEEWLFKLKEGETIRFARKIEDQLEPRMERMPFALRLEQFNVQFHDERPMLYVWADARVDSRPKLALDASKQQRGWVAGRKVETLGVEDRSVQPMPDHPPIPVTVLLARVDGKPVEFMRPAAGFARGYSPPAEQLGEQAYLFDIRKSPRRFESRLTLLDDADHEAFSSTISVNVPLIHQGYWLYQSDWDHFDHTYSGVRVIKDPGVWIAFVGLGLLVLGSLLRVAQEARRRS